MAAVMIKDIVQKRGHIIPSAYPFALDNAFETLPTAGQAKKVFSALGMANELLRVSERTIRAGKGAMRGRKYKKAHGPLIVVSHACPLVQAARNLPGIDVIAVDSLNANLLAPGAVHGRLTLFTSAALARISKENLFSNTYKGSSSQPNQSKKELVKTEKNIKKNE
ncbi:50S ribosomal protein L4 [Candidatus Woesearchaeota archaeon]|nr:50S ribosomal protein L4 [Candidatus Woesearchaeota archaeon]